MNRHAPHPTVDVQVTVRGRLPGAEDYAVRRVDEVLRLAPEPVLAARVKLTKRSDPAVRRRILAQANLDVRGRLVRAQADGTTVTEAVDLLHDRLRRQLEKAARHWEARRGHFPTDESWRHGHEPTRRPGFYPRPPEEREVVRHKTYTLPRISVDEAAFEMDTMDYDFHLFTEIETGQDSVLYRTADGFRLAQLEAPARNITTVVSLTVSSQAAAELTVAEAIERLNLSGLPFVFFRDAEQDRGCVLYHRYDGHYGLITPVDS